ncbi:MAG TPA: hypothetical protein EYH22_02030 [Candidatus Nanopusillus sp.]|nr:hypothetical protein [Candidatus Nanopusillus sp.]
MKVAMTNAIVLGIIFVSTLIISSSVYYFLTSPISTLYIPIPNGSYIALNITGEDLLSMLSSSINRFEPNLSKKDPELNMLIEKLNKIISTNKEEYLFYYEELQKIYPEKYFILCTQNGCGYYYYTQSGLVEANLNEMKIDKPLILLFDKQTLEKLIYLLEKRDPSVINAFKKGLIKGKIRVKNFEIVAKRIAEEYGEH